MTNTQTPKIRFILVGLGHIGSRYAGLLANHPEAELIGACDPEVKSQQHFQVWPNLETLLEKTQGQADVAIIATPNGLHSLQGIACLKAGLHIICEKPMALTTRDCDEMMAVAMETNKEIFCVMQNRFSPAAAWMYKTVRSGTLGDILMIRVDCFWNRDERYYTPGGWRGSADLDGGTLFTQFSHFLDLLLWVFGDIQEITGQFANFTHQNLIPFEDTGSFQFRLKNGGLGVFNYSTSVWDKNLESSITLIGRNGSVQIAGQYMNELKYCHLKNYTPPTLPETAPPNDYGGYQGSASNHHFVIQNVVDFMFGRAEKAVTPEEGRSVVELITRIYQKRQL